MRPLLTLAIGAALGAPTGVAAQEITNAPPADAQRPLAPPPFSEPVHPTPPAETAPRPPAVEAVPAPRLEAPTTVPPVLVQAEAKDNSVTQRMGGMVGGLLGGAAGAAAGGPIGKIAGSLVGKQVAKALVGGGKSKNGIPDVEVAQAAADTAAPPPGPAPR